jgi:uncharacterized protein
MSNGQGFSSGPKSIRKKVVLGGKEMELRFVEMRRPMPVEGIRHTKDSADGYDEKNLEGAGFAFCPPFNQRTYLATPDIICEQDVPVKLRDGITIYTDIYRPVGQTNLPAIISWSTFGKRPGDGFDEWQVIGVPPGTISRMAKFESPDPGYWCRYGYAVANVDPRGIGHSEGDTWGAGTAEGRDIYDFVEWLATQWWCSGKIGMSGNSGVAMSQWRGAAEQPPHLTCIAPWEGTGDLFRESMFVGGIPQVGFLRMMAGSSVGLGHAEASGSEHPFYDEYWQDKTPRYENIRIPAFVTGCWNHFHLRGSWEGFRKIRSTKKWMRVHREFEWPDTYCTENLEDLRRFYDRYLKDIRNGWELTPRIRIEVMDAYDCLYQKNRGEKEFPLARTQYEKLYLDASKGSLSWKPVAKESKVVYEPEEGLTSFTIKFKEDTEITGYLKLHMWVQAESHDDMDFFITVRKLDAAGKWVPVSILEEPHPGAWGQMRVSRRELDEKASTDFQPVQAHQRDLKLKPGEIVPVDIEIWPHSRIWHKGEQLELVVTGHYIREGWFEPLSWDTLNKGNHIIHTGGKYDSFLQVPVIPPRYVAGDYVCR